MLEVELRCFVSDAHYTALKTRLLHDGKLLEDTRQVTHYLDTPVDTRVQFSLKGGRIWQKMGKMHESAREEIEIKMTREDAENAFKIFENMGLGVKVSWFRHRLAFVIDGVTVTLDDTLGYGKIFEVELLVEEAEKHSAEKRLGEFLKSWGLAAAQKDQFDAAYKEYLATWREKTKAAGADWLS